MYCGEDFEWHGSDAYDCPEPYFPEVDILQNFYVSAIGGVNFRRQIQLTTPHDPGPGIAPAAGITGNLPGTLVENIRFNEGYHAGGAIGYIFEGGFRVEVEVSNRHQEIRSIQTADDSGSFSTGSEPVATGRVTPQGHTADIAIMANGYGSTQFTDYIYLSAGVGIGTAFNSLEISPYTTPIQADDGAATFDPIQSPVSGVRERNAEIAWQVIGAITYDTLESIVLSAQYRFFGTGIRDPFTRELGLTLPAGAIDATGTDLTKTTSRKTPYNHTVDFLMSWVF